MAFPIKKKKFDSGFSSGKVKTTDEKGKLFDMGFSSGKTKQTYEVKEKQKEELNNNSPKYLIEGYRWFDRVNGNTYHKVVITDLKNGQEVYRSKDIVYGYGDQWRYTAYKELEQKGLVKKEDQFNHDLNAKRFIYREHDVDRKKDLP